MQKGNMKDEVVCDLEVRHLCYFAVTANKPYSSSQTIQHFPLHTVFTLPVNQYVKHLHFSLKDHSFSHKVSLLNSTYTVCPFPDLQKCANYRMAEFRLPIHKIISTTQQR